MVVIFRWLAFISKYKIMRIIFECAAVGFTALWVTGLFKTSIIAFAIIMAFLLMNWGPYAHILTCDAYVAGTPYWLTSFIDEVVAKPPPGTGVIHAVNLVYIVYIGKCSYCFGRMFYRCVGKV